ncbi:dna polymerase epsilon, catalytic subunit, putative, partial [Perkinsus marinus ATCC 50983]
FRLDTNAIDELIESADKTCRFFVETEEKTTVDEIENFEEVVGELTEALKELRRNPHRSEEPLIYHLDVAAMYPNIILSNRLQPSAIVNPDYCNQCSYSDPQLKSDCKRHLEWKWRGDLYMATRADVQHQQSELSGPRHKYTTTVTEADGTSTVRKVGWDELTERERMEILIKNVRNFSLKAYKRVKSSVFEVKTDT